jgi:hypothetical protein
MQLKDHPADGRAGLARAICTNVTKQRTDPLLLYHWKLYDCQVDDR